MASLSPSSFIVGGRWWCLLVGCFKKVHVIGLPWRLAYNVTQSILVPFSNGGNSDIIQQLGLVLWGLATLVSPLRIIPSNLPYEHRELILHPISNSYTVSRILFYFFLYTWWASKICCLNSYSPSFSGIIKELKLSYLKCFKPILNFAEVLWG